MDREGATIKQITIFLGDKCNANCYYCHAKANANETKITDKFIDYIKKQSIDNKDFKIKFLGGEPTLYIKEISQIINICKNNNTKFDMVTNGLLLNNKEVVDFIVNNNIEIGISYDGKRGNRGYDDIFYRDEYIASLKKIKNIGCVMTLSSSNADLSEVIKELLKIRNKLKRRLPLIPHYVHVTKEELRRYALTNKQLDNLVEFYIFALKTFLEQYSLGVTNLFFRPIFLAVTKTFDRPFIYPESRCFNKDHVLTTLDGKNYLCSYYKTEETYLGEYESPQVYEQLDRIFNERFKQCINCEFYKYCGGHCLASKYHEQECHFSKSILKWLINYCDEHKINILEAHKKIAEQNKSGGSYATFR